MLFNPLMPVYGIRHSDNMIVHAMKISENYNIAIKNCCLRKRMDI